MQKSLTLPLTVALITAAAYVASTFWYAKDMPAYLATHFDFNGKPNGGMTHQGFINFSLVMGLGTQLFVSGIMFVIRFVPPRFVNIPNKEYWALPENYPVACRSLFAHSLWLGSMMVMWMGLLNYQIVECNKLHPPKLDANAFMLAMGTFVVMLAAWMIFLWREFRVPEKSQKKKGR